ncbi:MAG: flagellar hook-associated protein FlgK, partial [Caulobacteraceae bacterium]|nr:flagellar hook-associated protein FlgK [Caulobacter sp.]
MSLNSALSIASSGLQVAQAGLKVTSDNVANVNTPGYVRKVADQQSVYVAGQGGLGVSIAQIRTASDTFLQAASRLASADASSAQAVSDTLDQAQQLFGDPNGTSGLFSQLNGMFQGFIALAAAPSSSTRAAAVPQAQALFDQASDIGDQLGDLRSQATSRIGADVDTVNGLLSQIDGLNADISRATALGQDASGAQDQQSQALDKLAALLPVQVDQRSGGGVVVRSADGLTLAGAGGAATLSYDGSGAAGRFTATSASGVAFAMTTPGSGEIGGLAKLRDTSLPAMTAQLSELVGGAASALNAVHNQYSAVPPPVSMTGRDTGLDADTALSHFTGQETLAVTDATGAPLTAAVIDFDAKTVSVNGAVVGSFTDAASFTSTLNSALNGAATVDFTKSPATLVSSDTSSSSSKRLVLAGGALQADGTFQGAPATKAGQGFSAWFGLNDVVSSSGLSSYATGLQPADASGYSGGAISLRLTAPDGSTLR